MKELFYIFFIPAVQSHGRVIIEQRRAIIGASGQRGFIGLMVNYFSNMISYLYDLLLNFHKGNYDFTVYCINSRRSALSVVCA